MAKMHEANMRNFCVYYHEETETMFHHWECKSASPLSRLAQQTPKEAAAQTLVTRR